jgi:hypothetical protein
MSRGAAGTAEKNTFRDGQAETVLTFYVGGAKFADGATAVDGEYEFSDTSIVFRPYYALVPGVEYTAVAHVATFDPLDERPGRACNTHRARFHPR